MIKRKNILVLIISTLVLATQIQAQEIILHKPWKISKSSMQEELPVSVNNGKLKYFPPIISQIGGSCAQASTIGYMCTYELNRLLNRSASEKANRCSYLYTWNFINDGVDDGSLGTDGLTIGFNSGLMSEVDFPSQTSTYEFKWASGYDKYVRALQNKVETYNDIDVTTLEGITKAKHYLWNKNESGKVGGILTFSTQAEGWAFNDNYTGPSQTGLTCILTKLGTAGPHAMTITGYDDMVEFTAPDGSLHKGAFIVTNTHGTWRHDKGRFYLPYWFFLQDRIDLNLGRTMTGASLKQVQPKILFRLTFEYSSRNDLSFKIGVNDKATSVSPKHDYIVPIMNHQGGEHPMQGSYADPFMDVAFDFSPYINRLEGMTEPNFFLTITRAKKGHVYGEGKIHKISVYDYRNNPEKPQIYTVDLHGAEIAEGTTVYSIPTTKLPECSFSPVPWLDKYNTPISSPYVFRTASGKFVKVRLSDFNPKEGKVRIKYVYNPNGDRKLK